jgi:RimJ/RimL family protein N-acetyltransferase
MSTLVPALMPLTPSLPAVPVLETARLRLRGYQLSDLAAFTAMSQEPDFYRYLTPGPMPAEDVWNTMMRSVGHWALKGFGFWAVEEKSSGAFIGAVGFVDRKRNLDPPMNGDPEIGWVLAPSTHGQGYATEAVQAVQAWGDAHFSQARTVCMMDPDNLASRRVAEKFGYHEYARTTYHGDAVVLLERPQPQS